MIRFVVHWAVCIAACTPSAVASAGEKECQANYGYKKDSAHPTSGWTGVGWFWADKQLCTAFRISANVVATAAHCLSFKNNPNPVGAKMIFKDRTGQLYGFPVESWQAAPKRLARQGRLDFGLVQTSQLPEWVGIIKLSLDRIRPAGVLAVVAGGCSASCFAPGDQVYSQSRNDLTHRVAVFQGARFRFSRWHAMPRYNICPGDSGSPVIDLETGEAVGIISSYNRANRAIETTSVRRVLAWIARNVAD